MGTRWMRKRDKKREVNGRETGAGKARVNRWDGGFDGLKRIREATRNKRGS